MNKKDLLMYIAYGLAFVFAGICVSLSISGVLRTAGEGASLWFLMVGVSIIALAFVDTGGVNGHKKSNAMIGFGMVLSVPFGFYFLSAIGAISAGWGIAIVIALIGFGIIGIGINQYKESQVEDEYSE